MAEGRILSIEGVTAMAAGRIVAADDRIYATDRAKCVIFDVKRVPSEDT